MAELREGIVEVVANASLLAEGFDEPSLSAVILVRPTQSTALFVQQVGRALRPYPEKTCGFVIDAIGAAEQHGSAFGRLHRLEPDDGGTLARDLSDRAAADAQPDVSALREEGAAAPAASSAGRRRPRSYCSWTEAGETSASTRGRPWQSAAFRLPTIRAAARKRVSRERDGHPTPRRRRRRTAGAGDS